MISSGRDARLALREAVARLLRASDREDLASIVEGGEVEVCPSAETWQVGDRSVLAERMGLLVEPEAYVRLERDGAALGTIRDAFATVVRSFETELVDLSLFVRLPSEGGTSWGRAYRTAPRATRPEPTPEAVRAAAVALARAFDWSVAAEMLDRAELDVVPIAGAEDSLRRWVVRLSAADFARADRDPRLATEVETTVRKAAASATARVGEVLFTVGG